ncbi:MAG TPA: peptidase M23 [Micromonosporaceae bacterium]|nr:peptidase M23 [Micromonosporaceae bacterium]
MHVSFRTRLGAVLACGLLVALPAASAGQAAPAQAQPVEQAVIAKLLTRAVDIPKLAAAGEADTKVALSRAQGRWAFGTAVLVAPKIEDHFPYGWLFLAKRDGSGWQVAFDGEPDFGSLSRSAPVISERERRLFASHDGDAVTPQANGDFRTGMRLPFALGQSWYLRGGPHAWDAGSGPWSSLDLNGGDEAVRAARGGTAYTMCKGWLRVIHDRGYSTDYYHLWSNINVNGSSVGEGAFLGYTGTDITCGGAASGRHVHFALRQNSGYVGVAYHILGKWVPLNGGAQYGGSALHGSVRANVGGTMYNYGPLGFTQGIVDTVDGTSLNKRSGPGTGYPVVGSVADAATVSISCSANGTTHEGRWGATSLWNKLTDGTWVSDAFLYTGTDGTVNGYC